MTSPSDPPSAAAVATFAVTYSQGVHVRPAKRIAALASRHAGAVTATCGGESADAKDCLELLLLAAGPGDLVTFTVEGEPAASLALLEELRALFARRFDAPDF